MMNTATAEFAEGTLDLASDVWFCLDHSNKVKVGKPCLFCQYEEVGEAMFDKITLPD